MQNLTVGTILEYGTNISIHYKVVIKTTEKSMYLQECHKDGTLRSNYKAERKAQGNTGGGMVIFTPAPASEPIEAAEQDAIAAEKAAIETAAQAVVTDKNGIRFDGELIGEVATHSNSNHLAFYHVDGIEHKIGGTGFPTRRAAVNALAEMHRANIVLQAVATELRRCDKLPAPAPTPARKAYVPAPTLAETYNKPNDVMDIFTQVAERVQKFRAEAQREIAAAQAKIPHSKTADNAYGVAQTTRELLADIQAQWLDIEAQIEAAAAVVSSVFDTLENDASWADSEAHVMLDALELSEVQRQNIALRG